MTVNKMVGPFTEHDLRIVAAATAAEQYARGVMQPPPQVTCEQFCKFTKATLELLKGIQNLAPGWEANSFRFLTRRGEQRALFPMTQEERAIRESAGIEETRAVEYLSDSDRGLMWSRDYLHSAVPTDAYKVVPVLDQWMTVLGLAMLLREEFPTLGIGVSFLGGHEQRHTLMMVEYFRDLTPEGAAEITKRWKVVLRREDEVREIVTQPIPGL